MTDEPDPLEPILRAARESVERHDGTKREYPGYIWIEWDDLVRFVQAGSQPLLAPRPLPVDEDGNPLDPEGRYLRGLE